VRVRGPAPVGTLGVRSLRKNTSRVTNEESILEEAIASLREAAQCIKVTQNVMHSQGMAYMTRITGSS
jgi:hypothetical protein